MEALFPFLKTFQKRISMGSQGITGLIGVGLSVILNKLVWGRN